MARRKTLPHSARAKFTVAERLCELRGELFGERGAPEMARQLGLPVRTWYNYESGVTIPGEVVLRIIELTGVEPAWLLHGTPPRFRDPDRSRGPRRGGEGSESVGELLRSAIEILERRGGRAAGGEPAGATSGVLPSDPVDAGPTEEDDPGPALGPSSADPRFLAAHREWLEAGRECRCIRQCGGAMSPIVEDGALVAFSEVEEPLETLDGKLVLAIAQASALVRWFQHCGRYAILRAEAPDASDPPQILIDFQERPDEYRIRRVLWVASPH